MEKKLFICVSIMMLILMTACLNTKNGKIIIKNKINNRLENVPKLDTEEILPIFDDENDYTSSKLKTEKQPDKNTKTIKVGITNYPPYKIILKEDSYGGFDIEVIKAVFNEINYEYNFISYKAFDSAVYDIKVGEIDAFPSMTITDNRKTFLNFTEPYAKYEWVIFTNDDNQSIKGNNKDELIKSLYGKTVNIGEGYSILDTLKEHPQIKIITRKNSYMCFESLAKGETDAVIDDKLTSLYIIKQNDFNLNMINVPLKEDNYSTAVSTKTDEKFIEEYNKGLEKIKKRGFYKNIYDRWFSIEPGKASTFNRDTIKIGITNYPPYKIRNEDGTYTGFDIDIIKEIFRRNNWKYDFIHYRAFDSADYDIKTGEIDLFPSMTITESRKSYMNFTKPYAQYEWSFFVRKTDTEIGGNTKEQTMESLINKTVCTGEGYAILDELKKYPNIKVLTKKTSALCFDTLWKLKSDAVIDDKYTSLYYIKQELFPFKEAGLPLKTNYYATAVSKKIDPAFITQYNKTLDEIIKDGYFDNIYNKWFRKEGE